MVVLLWQVTCFTVVMLHICTITQNQIPSHMTYLASQVPDKAATNLKKIQLKVEAC